MFPIAQYELHENAIPKLSAIGNFTKNGPCFAIAQTTKRVCVFDTTLSPELAKSFVNAGQKVTCMGSIKIRDQDCVIIGTDNSLLVYNVEQNSQCFTSLISDGVFSITVDRTNTIYVGSNCAILGYDTNGEEVFWTVSGDVVTAMCEAEMNGNMSLIAASNDLVIRVFVGEESKREMRIHFPCSFLKAAGPDEFIAGFDNGSISLYKNLQKVWNCSTQDTIIGFTMIDFSGRKQKDLVVGCGEGSLLFLDMANGQVSRKENLEMHLASIGLVDFKGDGRLFLSVIGTNGSIRVFMPKGAEGLGHEAKQAFNLRQAQPKYVQEKAKLLMRRYELSSQLHQPSKEGQTNGIPAGMMGNYKLGKNLEEQCIELQIQTDPPTPIQGTIVQCPTTSSTDFVVFDLNNPATATHKILLWLPNDVTGFMKVESFVNNSIMAFNINFQKFYSFSEVKDAHPTGYAEFEYSGDMFSQFVAKNFVMRQELNAQFRICYASVTDREPLVLTSNGKVCRIECESVATAARIASEFCDFSNTKEFPCRAHFPDDLEALMEAVKTGGDLDDTKSVHRAEVAGLIAAVKDTIVRIENAEIIEHYGTLYDSVVECERLNGELAREHAKRMTNKETLGTGNQKINAMIQSFAELRRGNARNTLLQLCRRDLQSHDYSKLPYILEYGHDIVTK